MRKWLTDLLLFFFPSNCVLCGSRLPGLSEVLCLNCEFRLPRTGFGDREDNPVNRIFWGRVHVTCATSLFRFEKGSAYQSLLHELKYRHNKKAGIYLGKLLGYELRSTRFSRCDLIVPVPLHPRKIRSRGYNQSELIGRGTSGVMGIPLVTDLLVRIRHHESQTGRGRYERYENVTGNFCLGPYGRDLSGSRVLIIDDVVTTGATLEACSRVLLERYRCQVYIATVSCA